MSAEAERYTVMLTAGANADLQAIHDYLVRMGEPARADALLDRLLVAAETLARFPERGSCPKELVAVGIEAYRQIIFKPYRMIYRILDHRVVIYLVADGRRNMQSVLAHRLLGG